MIDPDSRRRRFRVAMPLAGLLLAAPAHAGRKTPTMPVSEIRPGMRGHAVTVFSGEATDQFEVEIIDVIPNYLPRQDAILFRSNDPRMVHSGIVGGMSGSPIYIEGKLVGALAYGWRFNKDALGALTPISNMQEVGALPYRPELRSQPTPPRTRPGTRAWADTMLGLDTSPLPARRTARSLDPAAGLTALQAPLSVAGLGAEATRLLADVLALEPVRGGGTSGGTPEPAPAEPKRWKGGDSVSVVMIEGDSTAAANGTVTWVSPKGDRLLAFGHSMFDEGPTNIPMADAKVHTIINSVDRSVKISSPLTVRGVMYQDRQPAIALRTDVRAPTIDVHTTVRAPDPESSERTYSNRVAVGRSLTPGLTAAILSDAVDEASRDATELTLQLRHELVVETSRGVRDVVIDEEVFFPEGLIGRVLQRSRGIVLLAALLNNEFEIPRIQSVHQTLSFQYGAPVRTIDNVQLVQENLHAGDVAQLDLTLTDFRGRPQRSRIEVRIPDDAGDEEISIQIAGGGEVEPYRPLPKGIDDLIDALELGYPERSIVVTVYREREGLATRQGLLRSLPDSVLETLIDRGGTREEVRFKQMSRRVVPTADLISGEHEIKVDVLPRTSH